MAPPVISFTPLVPRGVKEIEKGVEKVSLLVFKANPSCAQMELLWKSSKSLLIILCPPLTWKFYFLDFFLKKQTGRTSDQDGDICNHGSLPRTTTTKQLTYRTTITQTIQKLS